MAEESKVNNIKAEVPSKALMVLLSPDGYYTYLGIEKGDKIDEELVRKNYRRLSLKHHPDRPKGDEETFRALNRAQLVLLHAKLKQQYDLIGLDLEEDHEDHHHEHGHEPDSTSSDEKPPSRPDTIVSHMASATLATILQSLVRTAMMGVVAVVLTRYKLTVFLAVAFLVFVAFRVRILEGSASGDLISPLFIGTGLLLMFLGRDFPDTTWSFTFWIGEGLVATMFTHNSLPPQNSAIFLIIIAALAYVLTLWTRGDMWKYLTLVALQIVLAIILALLFPIMEMLLEAILNEKLRKVGDKVRANAERMEAYYTRKK